LRRLLILVLILLVTVLGAVAGGGAAKTGRAATAPSTIAHKCKTGWRHAIIGGEHKCLRAGQFCAKRYERQYRRYGYTCRAGRLRKL
jgi:hypothetical protein